MAHNYILRVTAGPGYDLATHAEVAVNAPRPLRLSTPLADVALSVRVQRYRGLPRGSPASSPYFEAEPHRSGGDQYGIAIEFTPKAPAGGGGGEETEEEEEGADGEGQKKKMKKKRQGISGADLQFGNDFDHPIRDRLPPGFGTAMNIVKWWIDPGLEGDVHADKPYLYGPALSSFNAVHVGPPAFDEARGGLWVDEGGDAAGLKSREAAGAPADRKARMKWALQASSKDRWVWEYGTTYGLDFYNAYLDFNDFALRLPGFTLPIMKYWDGQGLRYVSEPPRLPVLLFLFFFFFFGSLALCGERQNEQEGKRNKQNQYRSFLKKKKKTRVLISASLSPAGRRNAHTILDTC
jgi:hypothetical protein